MEVVKRVAIGVYNDGFIHAGNLAYLALLALFPFFILAAAVAHLLGQTEDAQLTVGDDPRPAAAGRRERRCASRSSEVLTARTGPLLWFGAIVGLWTAASFIETIRDILRRAYGVKYCAPLLGISAGLDRCSSSARCILLMIAFAASVALSSVQHCDRAMAARFRGRRAARSASTARPRR